MAQPLNKPLNSIQGFLTQVGKGWKILVWNAAFEFYADANVEDHIQIPARNRSNRSQYPT